MNSLINSIASSVLSKDLALSSADELKKLAEDHPYAGALQLLYSQKLKENGGETTSAQWQRTLLYFNDSLFLQHVATAQDVIIENKAEDSEIFAEEPQATTRHEEVSETQITGEEPEAANVFEDIETEPETIDIPGLKIEPIDPKTAAFNFTPYYTVDYFASQGIKLGDEATPGDRFGNQLRTFTSWLKEMRRLPEAEVVSKFSAFEQTKVERMAENSLTGENAVTEAMAQVWIKQQNPQKAIDIYKKLSLQNPAKSAFFAAKIEHLKKQL